jgi:hypothetical protein
MATTIMISTSVKPAFFELLIFILLFGGVNPGKGLLILVQQRLTKCPLQTAVECI